MAKLKLVIVCFCLSCFFLEAQKSFDFDSLFKAYPTLFKISKEQQKYRIQIIYTQINRDKSGKPSFKNYTYKLDSSNYFYCASMIKLPCSVLALEKINALSDKGIDKNTIMFTDSAYVCQRSVKQDTSSENNYPSVAQYIKKMLIISDNIAYGRIYEFLGVDYLHNRLIELGYKNMFIVHRFDGGCKGAANLITNPVSFYDKEFKLLFRQEQQNTFKTYKHPLGVVKVGEAYINSQNKKINEPKDFSNMNYISLENIHSFLQRLVFNDYLSSKIKFKITEDDHKFLLRYLAMLPEESRKPTYNKNEYYDSYKKYFIYGDSKKPITDTNVRIMNIVGQSYGFMADCAYIQNKSKNIEFMLSAVIYTNENKVINDGKYEYKTVALPFLAELGRAVYTFEKARK